LVLSVGSGWDIERVQEAAVGGGKVVEADFAVGCADGGATAGISDGERDEWRRGDDAGAVHERSGLEIVHDESPVFPDRNDAVRVIAAEGCGADGGVVPLETREHLA
jgi:hypothetical protein